MIVVTITLVSAVTGEATQLGEMHIANDGKGTDSHCNYDGIVLRKPDFKLVTREGRVEKHARHAETIWHLVGKMLKSMGYAK